MKTILFSIAGIAALIAVAFLSTYFETLRNKRIKSRLAKIRGRQDAARGSSISALTRGMDVPVI